VHKLQSDASVPYDHYCIVVVTSVMAILLAAL
jgi:hypothetical protein